MGVARAPWLLFVSLVACGPSTPEVTTPIVDTRRMPNNRAELDGAGSREQYRDAAPPTQPVVPPQNWGRCLRSRMCGFEGLCTPTEQGDCMAASNADCRDSDACLGGRCTAKNGVCIAGSDADCRGSWACKGWGRCYHDGHELCIATDQADCTASTRCKREGECSLSGGACVKAP